jgi:formate dehydrogenase alpha subunit (EC 1.2.1.2)
VAKLINGYYLKDTKIKNPDGTETVMKAGSQVATFAHLQADGSTCSGNWIYAGSYTDKGNMAARRDKTQTPAQEKVGMYPNWSWTWPVNRRIIYNRASVDLAGNPYQPDKPVLAWDAPNKKWVIDVVDGGGDPGAKHPFIMQQHGLGALYGPGLNDGPSPNTTNPWNARSPSTVLQAAQQPHGAHVCRRAHKRTTCDPRFPFVCTTYRVTEHWQTGVLTRWLPWLTEAQPQMFCEMSEELAELKGIKNGEKVILENPAGSSGPSPLSPSASNRLKSWAIRFMSSASRGTSDGSGPRMAAMRPTC